MVFSQRKFRRYSHYLGRYLVDRIAVLFTGAKQSGVLLIIRPDGIGDFVVWLDSVRALREHFSDRKIVLVANKIFSELAVRLEYFDEVIAVDLQAFEWDLSSRYRTIRRIRRLGAELAIQPIFSRRFWIGDAMIHASGARRRIGSEGDVNYLQPWQQRLARRWYTRFVPADAGLLSELERNLEFLRGMGLDKNVPSVGTIPVVAELSPSLQIPEEYFIVFPGAGSTKRMWPPTSYAAAARAIAEKTGWRMVVCGSGAEAELAETIIEDAGLRGAVMLAGRTTVPELVEVIRGARMLIGSETSAVHIAAAVNTPSICLLGGGHFGRFVPYPDNTKGMAPIPVFHKMECYGCNWKCTMPHEDGRPVPCITIISVADVVAAFEVILSKRQFDAVETH